MGLLTKQGGLDTDGLHRRLLHEWGGRGQGGVSTWDASGGQNHWKLGEACDTFSLRPQRNQPACTLIPDFSPQAWERKACHSSSQTRSPGTLLPPLLLQK